jgi:hypothetical protein
MEELRRRYRDFNDENKDTINNLKTNVPDLIAKVESGQLNPDDTAFPADDLRYYLPGQSERLIQEWNDAGKVYTMMQGLRMAPQNRFDEIANELTGGQGTYYERIKKLAGGDSLLEKRLFNTAINGLQRIVKERQDAVDKDKGDPAGYVISNSANQGKRNVNLLAQAWAHSKNPTDFDAYASTLTNVEKDFGLEGNEISVTPRPVAEAWGKRLIDAGSSGADNVLQELRKQVGDKWLPDVYRDILRFNPNVPASTKAVLALHDNPAMQQAYIVAAAEENPPSRPGEKPKEFAGWPERLGHGDRTAGTTTVSGIDAAVDKAFLPYQKSMLNSGNDIQQALEVQKEIKLTAYGRMLMGETNPATAAKDATSAFLDGWDYVTQGGARVPRVSTTTTRGLDIIGPNIERFWSDWYKWDNFDLPTPDESKGQSKDSLMKDIKSNGEWVTAPDNSGLYYRVSPGVGGGLLRGRDGKPIKLNFSNKEQAYSSNVTMPPEPRPEAPTQAQVGATTAEPFKEPSIQAPTATAGTGAGGKPTIASTVMQAQSAAEQIKINGLAAQGKSAEEINKVITEDRARAGGAVVEEPKVAGPPSAQTHPPEIPTEVWRKEQIGERERSAKELTEVKTQLDETQRGIVDEMVKAAMARGLSRIDAEREAIDYAHDSFLKPAKPK